MIFKVRFELAPFGEELKDSYAVFKLLDRNQAMDYVTTMSTMSTALNKENISDESAVKQSKAIFDHVYQTVKDSFLYGEVFDDTTRSLRPMTKEDIDTFPLTVAKDITSLIRGEIEKKS